MGRPPALDESEKVCTWEDINTESKAVFEHRCAVLAADGWRILQVVQLRGGGIRVFLARMKFLPLKKGA